MIQILGLMGMYFDTVVVEVKTFLLLFRLALAILCKKSKTLQSQPKDLKPNGLYLTEMQLRF